MPDPNPMRAIILAAGRGSRMGALTDPAPKCLTTLAGQTLLDWQREKMAQVEAAESRAESLVDEARSARQAAPQMQAKLAETEAVVDFVRANEVRLYSDNAYCHARCVDMAALECERGHVFAVAREIRWRPSHVLA